MKDSLESIIQNAISAGATPAELARIIAEFLTHSQTFSDPNTTLSQFQNKINTLLNNTPEQIPVPSPIGTVYLVRKIEHSIATNSITLSYSFPNSHISVRHVFDTSEIPDSIPDALQSISHTAQLAVSSALNPTPQPNPPPNNDPSLPILSDDCPHASVP